MPCAKDDLLAKRAVALLLERKRQDGKAVELDFFYVHPSLVGKVEAINKVPHATISPHYPVAICW